MSTSSSDLNLTAWPIRTIVQATLVVTAIGLLFWLVARYHYVFLLLFAAVIISTALKPLVDRLMQLGISRPLAMAAAYVLLAALLAVFGALIAPLLISSTTDLAQTLTESYHSVRFGMLDSANRFYQQLADSLPENPPFLSSPAMEEADTAAMAGSTGNLLSGLRAVGGIGLILILTVLWTIEGDRVKQRFLFILPPDRRIPTRELMTAIETRLGNFALGQTVLCLLIAVLSLVAYLLLGLPSPLSLAVFAGIMEAVPMIGPAIGALPAVIVAFTISPWLALLTLLAAGIIQLLENYLLVPQVMKRAVGVSSLVTLLSLIIFGSAFGVLGALIAIPAAVVIDLLLQRTIHSERFLLDPTNNGRDFISRLRYDTRQIVQDIRGLLRAKGDFSSADNDHYEDQLESLALDVDRFLAGEAVSGEGPA